MISEPVSGLTSVTPESGSQYFPEYGSTIVFDTTTAQSVATDLTETMVNVVEDPRDFVG